MTATGTETILASEVERGDVIDNVWTRSVVEEARLDGHAITGGYVVRITYRYVDDRGIVRGATFTARPDEEIRVRTGETMTEVLDATLGSTR